MMNGQVKGFSHDAPPILTKEQVLENLKSNNKHKNTDSYKAFYSSIIGGITRDPSAMVVPIDDHMVHRGHAVFDTVIIHRGQLYELDEHLDRLLTSASNAKIKDAFSREQIRNLIFATASASGLQEGYLRYWLSAGPGGFSVSPSECPAPVLYILAIEELLAKNMGHGVRIITARTPMKSAMMSTTKTVNYLPNALVQMEGEEAGVFTALWIDDRGNVAEGPCMNVAFVSREGQLLVPSFDRILAGCTMNRVMKLAEGLVQSESARSAPLLKGVKFAPVPEAEAREASEMFLVGSGVRVLPIVEWDGQKVGEGVPGPVATALHELLLQAYAATSLTQIPELYS